MSMSIHLCVLCLQYVPHMQDIWDPFLYDQFQFSPLLFIDFPLLCTSILFVRHNEQTPALSFLHLATWLPSVPQFFHTVRSFPMCGRVLDHVCPPVIFCAHNMLCIYCTQNCVSCLVICLCSKVTVLRCLF